MDVFFRHGWTRLLKKDTAGLRNGNGLISLKAILKYRHGSLTLVFYRPQIGTD